MLTLYYTSACSYYFTLRLFSCNYLSYITFLASIYWSSSLYDLSILMSNSAKELPPQNGEQLVYVFENSPFISGLKGDVILI